jgi:hypothetical protein
MLRLYMLHPSALALLRRQWSCVCECVLRGVSSGVWCARVVVCSLQVLLSSVPQGCMPALRRRAWARAHARATVLLAPRCPRDCLSLPAFRPQVSWSQPRVSLAVCGIHTGAQRATGQPVLSADGVHTHQGAWFAGTGRARACGAGHGFCGRAVHAYRALRPPPRATASTTRTRVPPRHQHCGREPRPRLGSVSSLCVLVRLFLCAASPSYSHLMRSASRRPRVCVRVRLCGATPPGGATWAAACHQRPFFILLTAMHHPCAALCCAPNQPPTHCRGVRVVSVCVGCLHTSCVFASVVQNVCVCVCVCVCVSCTCGCGQDHNTHLGNSAQDTCVTAAASENE